jgi:pyruvate-ferredoxin/flavodoxin oxidoreductase
VFHIAARSLATQALSIFGDHSDVMAARSTGFGMLSSNSVQEVMDMALIAQAASMESRIPFLHFFDGFRTSHEVAKVEQLTVDDLRAMIDEDLVHAHRERRYVPRSPHPARHGAESRRLLPGREAGNPFYLAAPPSCRTPWTSSPNWWAGSIVCSITWARRMPSASSS